MKKFTFPFILILIFVFAGAQNKTDLQIKIQKAQEKFSRISHRNALLSKLSESQALNPESFLKSAAAMQKLDSTVDRVLNTETQTWQNDYKDEFVYSVEFKIISWVEKEWNSSLQTWSTLSKTDLGYDNQNRVNSMLMYNRDLITQVLTPDSKFLLFYNPDGMQDSSLINSTTDGGVTWILDMKQINHYNASKQLIKTDTWALDEDLGVLTIIMNMVYTYTASGKIKTSSTSYVMDGEEILFSAIEYNYDSADRLISTEYSMINFMTFSLEKSSSNTYQYNASGAVSVEIYSEWYGGVWVNKEKIESEYNAEGDLSIEINSNWNGASWVGEYKDEYTYSTTDFSEVAFPAFISLFGMDESDFSFTKAISLINSFEMIDGNWKNNEKNTFYYSGGTSSKINEFENSVISVYPNPAFESINFNWKGNNDGLTLQIYQITGVRVLEQITYSGKPVSISKLANGVYFFKLLSGQQLVHSGKMIKE